MHWARKIWRVKKNFLPIQIEDETLCYAADRWECACSCSVSQCHKQISVINFTFHLPMLHIIYIKFRDRREYRTVRQYSFR
jgi:hypothetical protein